jgi:type VI secretion system protein ImpB
MPRYEPTQARVKQTRESRVQITHEVHLPDGTVAQESLPLAIGVIADLSGDSEAAKLSMFDQNRDFVRINKSNFDTILEGHKPRVAFGVPNTLTGKGDLAVDLSFERLDDFHPDAVAARVPEIREQLDTRKRLDQLRSRLSGNPRLEAQLEEIISDPARRAQLLAEMARRREAAPAPHPED